ncbi:MAG TPA: hypothetical protein VFT32_05915 [Candidatus Eisenbacteria bacterium]|nr:hypothetical protein [Candidatus Eisenbacteria bacterium]
MNEQYIKAEELAALVALFVGPILLGAGVTQFILLRRAGCRMGPVLGILAAAALVTLLLTWGLLYVLPAVALGGAVFLLPALVAATWVTVVLRHYARRRRPPV